MKSRTGPIEVYVCGDEEQQHSAPPPAVMSPQTLPPEYVTALPTKKEPGIEEHDLSREMNLNYSWSSALSDEPSDIENSLSLADRNDGFIDHTNPHNMSVDPSLLPYLTNNGEDDFISLSPLPEYPDLCDGLQQGEGIADLYDVNPFPVKTWS